MKTSNGRPIIWCLRPRHLSNEGKPAKYRGDYLQGVAWRIESEGSGRIVIEDATGHRTVIVNTDLDGKRGYHRYPIAKALLGKIKVLFESEDDSAIARVIVKVEDDCAMENYRY